MLQSAVDTLHVNYAHRRNFRGDWQVRTPLLEWGDGPPLPESIKSEILPSKQVTQKWRVQTVM